MLWSLPQPRNAQVGATIISGDFILQLGSPSKISSGCGGKRALTNKVTEKVKVSYSKTYHPEICSLEGGNLYL